MKARLLQMKSAKAAEEFHKVVGTAEPDVNFDVRALDTEASADRLCMVELPNQGSAGGFCRAYLAPEHIEALIAALNAWKALP